MMSFSALNHHQQQQGQQQGQQQTQTNASNSPKYHELVGKYQPSPQQRGCVVRIINQNGGVRAPTTSTNDALSMSSSHSTESSWDDLTKDLKRFEISQSNNNNNKKQTTAAPSASSLHLISSGICPMVRTGTQPPATTGAAGSQGEQAKKKTKTKTKRNSAAAAGLPERQQKPVVTPTQTAEVESDVRLAECSNKKPYEFLMSLLTGIKLPDQFTAQDWDDYFAASSTTNDNNNTTALEPQRVKSFARVLKALRKDDAETLEKIYKQSTSGLDWNACNSHGEQLIHLACREGAVSVVKFLLEIKHVSVQIRDASGKTPLHEVAWFTHPPKFEIVSLILSQAPELLFVKDDRGWTALDYTPHKCRSEWCRYLQRKQSFLRMIFQVKACRRAGEKLYSIQQRLHKVIKDHVVVVVVDDDDDDDAVDNDAVVVAAASAADIVSLSGCPETHNAQNYG